MSQPTKGVVCINLLMRETNLEVTWIIMAADHCPNIQSLTFSCR